MKITITPEVRAVFERSEITETSLILPVGNLDRKLYMAVNAAIEAAGGKWDKKTKSHIFQSDPRERLGLALEVGTIVDEAKAAKKERQAFYTPEAVAEEVALLAGVNGHRVLEPSAGDGALAAACLKYGANQVDCIEKEESCRGSLVGKGRAVSISDFLTMEPYRQFDRIVMNPPFSKGQDVKHIQHAVKWLTASGMILAIVPDSTNPKLEAMGAEVVQKFPAGAFKESGTQIATRLIRIIKAA